jgi:hypothetical protein
MGKPSLAQARRIRDAAVNGARAAELHAWDLPCGWIVVSPVECQALLDGVVSAAIQRQAVLHLRLELEQQEDSPWV